MTSLKIPELEASFDEADTMRDQSVWGSTLCTCSDICSLQLAPSIKSHKLWCQTRMPLFPVAQAGKMPALKLIHYFPVIQYPLDSGLLHHQIVSL